MHVYANFGTKIMYICFMLFFRNISVAFCLCVHQRMRMRRVKRL